ncbi:MAG: lipid A deacylase LpxR family protein [Burkholderiales bacterium]|jgi:lipid A 3-O-deacylase
MTPGGGAGSRSAAAVRAGLAAGALGAALAGAPAPAVAQLRAFEFRLDNDTFVTPRREDERWYTSGGFVRFAFDAPADAADARLAAAWCARVVACDPGARTLRVASLVHRIYTPASTGTAGPQPYDRPYGAALALGAASVVVGERTRQSLELQLGTIGPAALGEPVQNGIHAMLGQAKAQGWPWQLRPQALAQVGWSRLASHRLGVPGVDAVTRTGVLLGTPQTQAELGAMLRFGGLGAGPTWPGESIGVREPSGWQVYAGVEARAVARDTLIDGTAFGYDSRVSREPIAGSAFVGASVGPIRDWRLEFTFAVHSVPFSSPLETYPFRPQRIGTIGLRWQPR